MKRAGAGMQGAYDKIDGEVRRGRLWRAREMLQGRLRDAAYDTEAFRRYGEVLAAMHDADMAGRYLLLAGVTEGEPGQLARAFLDRRRNADAAKLWASMPKAARRLTAPKLPEGTRALLIEAGHHPRDVDNLARKLSAAATAARRAKKPARSRKLPPTRTATAFAWMIFALLCVVMALGLLRTIAIGMDFLRFLF